MAFEVTHVDSVYDNTNLALAGASAVALTQVGGTSVLFAAGAADDGVSSFVVGSDGMLSEADTVTGAAGLLLAGASSLATAQVGGKTFLLAAAEHHNAVTSFLVNANGTLTFADSDADNFLSAAVRRTKGTEGVEVIEVDGSLQVIVTGRDEDGLSRFTLGADGTLSHIQSVNVSFTAWDRPTEIATAVVNGQPHFFTANVGSNNIQPFWFNTAGFQIGPTAGASSVETTGAVDVATAEVGGTVYIFVAGFAANGIGVFQGDGTGNVSNVFNLDDGDLPGLHLNGIRAVETAQIDGITYLFAGGADGLSIFTVDNAGALTNVQNIADSADFALGGISGLEALVIDGIIHLAISSLGEDGVSLFRIQNNIIDDAAMTLAIAENTTPVTSVSQLYDEDPVTYSLGGVDAGFFTIDGDGNLTFIDAPDFEKPTDADGDNVYQVEVIAEDGVTVETKLLTIEVTNVSAPKIIGTKKKDKLKGFAGGDLLDGGKKKDKLIGGEDADQFRFSSKHKNKWADKIKDFEVGVDTILLDRDVFKKIGKPGALDEALFDKGKKADLGSHRINYDKKTGNLFYDKDGARDQNDPVKFAKLDKGLKLSADDFWVV